VRSGKQEKARSRWKRNTALVLLIIVSVALIGVSALKAYEVWLLPGNYKNLNAQALKKIEKDWEKFETEFIDKDGRTHGYSMAVIGDNHASRHTFSRIIDRINDDNSQNRKLWLAKKAELAKLNASKTIPEAEKTRKAAALETLIDEIHKKQTLFVIDCGDLAYDGDVTKYRLTLELFNRLDMPIVTAIGNHDIRGEGRPAYRDVFGPENYSFVIGNSDYIVVDDANGKRIEPAQMAWLKKQLEESKPYDDCFVIMHVPPFKGHQNPNVPMTKFLRDKKNAQDIQDLATKYHVSFVLAGHIHTYDAAYWDIKSQAPEGLADARLKQNEVLFVITGASGARLWKVDNGKDDVLSRARYHYFDVIFNAEITTIDPVTGKEVTQLRDGFERNTIKVSHPDAWYTYEEIWTTSYAKIVELYPWEMLVLAPLFVVLLGYVVFDMRRGKKQASAD
jgi:3',5'-cyclic AMP phosphodiesterase CpdA